MTCWIEGEHRNSDKSHQYIIFYCENAQKRRSRRNAAPTNRHSVFQQTISESSAGCSCLCKVLNKQQETLNEHSYSCLSTVHLVRGTMGIKHVWYLGFKIQHWRDSDTEGDIKMIPVKPSHYRIIWLDNLIRILQLLGPEIGPIVLWCAAGFGCRCCVKLPHNVHTVHVRCEDTQAREVLEAVVSRAAAGRW